MKSRAPRKDAHSAPSEGIQRRAAERARIHRTMRASCRARHAALYRVIPMPTGRGEGTPRSRSAATRRIRLRSVGSKGTDPTRAHIRRERSPGTAAAPGLALPRRELVRPPLPRTKPGRRPGSRRSRNRASRRAPGAAKDTEPRQEPGRRPSVRRHGPSKALHHPGLRRQVGQADLRWVRGNGDAVGVPLGGAVAGGVTAALHDVCPSVHADQVPVPGAPLDAPQARGRPAGGGGNAGVPAGRDRPKIGPGCHHGGRPVGRWAHGAPPGPDCRPARPPS